MAYNQKFNSKEEFMIDRIPMLFGSLANFYSNSSELLTSGIITPESLYSQAVEFCDRIWSWGKRYDSFPELEKKLEEHFLEDQKERKIGRYHSSELWALINGRILPKDFLKPRVFDEESRQKMFWGTIVHEGIQKLFNFEEKKYEIKINENITIACKIDLELGKDIWEIKTREDIDSFDDVPPWYQYQCLAYLKAKNLKEMNLILIGWGFSRRIFKVKWDEKVWDYIVEKLLDYDKKLRELK